MLINFRVENFRSFKKEVNFNLYATADTEHRSTHTIATAIEKNNILSSAVIFGPNASGKSNLIQAMIFMRHFVEQSALSYKANDTIRIKPFKLSSESDGNPSSFEITFLANGRRYRYGFSVDKNKVHEEWLYHKPGYRETPLFIRRNQEITHLSSVFQEGSLIKKQNKTRENALFLSVVAQFNGEISKEILQWFNKFNVTSNVGRNSFEHYTVNMLSNPEHRNRIIKFIRAVDFGIAGLKRKDRIIPMSKASSAAAGLELGDGKQKVEVRQTTIRTSHVKYGPNKEFLELIDFNLAEESIGSQKFILLAGPIIETLINGEVLVIDELDNSFHSLMTEFIVKLFHSPNINKNNAQLVFATHDTNILKQELFRRDQIWFAEKDLYGESSLTPLISFGARKDASLEKNYLDGRYGATPYINDDVDEIFNTNSLELGL